MWRLRTTCAKVVKELGSPVTITLVQMNRTLCGLPILWGLQLWDTSCMVGLTSARLPRI